MLIKASNSSVGKLRICILMLCTSPLFSCFPNQPGIPYLGALFAFSFPCALLLQDFLLNVLLRCNFLH
ncbi:hypothetical protein HanPSC8_Chr06g0243191 [Helianthus annuus]|nr:hypothetical protein HanPSC8_Chr06g0243191 [Helianthus annuus]